MFANMKIGLRLSLGFAVVLALMAALAAVGLNGMASVEDSLNGIVHDNMVKNTLSNDMADAINVVSRITRDIVLLENEAERAAEKRKLDTARQKYNETLDALAKMGGDDKEKDAIAKIKVAAAEGRPLTDKVVDLGLANKSAEATK